MRLSLDTVRPILAVIGVFVLMAAAGAYLIFSEFNLYVRILAAAGVLLLGVFVALDPQEVLERLTARRTIYGGNTALMVVAFIGILAVLNALGTRFSHRWDLTATQQYTLSEKTTAILDGLEQPVKVTGFFGTGDPRRPEAEDLLKEYQVRSGGKIESEFVDPELEPAKTRSMGVREFGTLVFQQGDRRQNTTGISEQEFTTALLKLTRPTRKKIYFTQGHGERNLDAGDQAGYSQLKAALQQDNYEVGPLTLVTQQEVPADAAAVLIAGPTKDFLPEEKQAIKDYLAAGGKLMLLQDPMADVTLDELFSQWKVSLGKDPVVDPRSALPNDVRALVIQRYGPHLITEKMRIISVLPLAAPVIYSEEPIEGVSVTPIALSTEASWVETDSQEAKFDEGQDTRGPVALAAAIEAGATNPQRAPSAEAGDVGRPQKTRVVIIGDTDFIANDLVQTPTGNLDLLLNAVNWLAESEDLITIRPKERENRQLFLTATQMNLIMFSSMIFLPLVVGIAGAAVWWARR